MRRSEPPPDPSSWFGETVGPGEHRRLALTVGESYSSADIKIPLFVWRGLAPGPNVAVTAAVHGDEINGTGVIRSLIMDRPFELLAGTLVLVPVVNVLGFERHSRYLPDRRDLNRCFPGTLEGSLASRLARAFFDQVIRRCDYGIDLHTAALRRTNVPNVRADMSDPEVARFARAFGAELIVSGPGPKGSLRKSACKAGKPTFILEAGEPWKVEPSVVEYAVRGIRSCLAWLGMLDEPPHEPAYRVETDATKWVRARHGGFLRFHVAPGEMVTAEQPIATNTSLTGRHLGTIVSPRDGIVLGMTTLPAVAPGDPVAHIAFPKDGALRRIERAVEGLPDASLHERLRDDLASSLWVTPQRERASDDEEEDDDDSADEEAAARADDEYDDEGVGGDADEA